MGVKGEEAMKLSSTVFAAIVTLVALAFAADGAFASDSKPVAGMTTHGGSKGYGATAQPTTNCPTGKVWNAATKKCVEPTATPLNNRQTLNGEVESPMPQDRGAAPAPNGATTAPPK